MWICVECGWEDLRLFRGGSSLGGGVGVAGSDGDGHDGCRRLRDAQAVWARVLLSHPRGGGLIQGPTHPEFWHTHRPTNVPPPPPGGGGGGV